MSTTNSKSRSRTFSRTVSATLVFLRRQLWVWPIIAGVVLGTIGWFVRSSIERTMKESMAANLKTILNADVAALKLWLHDEKQYAQVAAADSEIQIIVHDLVQLAGKDETTDTILASSKAIEDLKVALQPWVDAREYAGFTIIDPNGQILAADNNMLVGKSDVKMPEGMLQSLFPQKNVEPDVLLQAIGRFPEPGKKPRPFVSRPFRSAILLKDKSGKLKVGVPTMFVVAPVLNNGKAVAGLALRIRPEDDFTRILSIARAGESGETYAFDTDGLLISQSRFDDDLKSIGLLADRDDEQSILNIKIRDPQVNMVDGVRPSLRRAEQPLTKMATEAVAGNDGHDVDGYNDYRGVPVIGAWTWLPEYGFGITSEVDVAEAYRPLYVLRYTFWGLFALLGASALAIFIFSIVVSKLNRKARLAVLEAKQLGQYSLDKEIGRGGMGVVYLGHHAMLQRPTAVKLLHADKTTAGTIARFEREVRLTSQLVHPNTIAIYDYGRTPEGVFYYAMEFLDGITLDDLIKQFGPMPESRVIHILKQICGSLMDAHNYGLIHRDIKPANIVLNRRGGIADFIKVLDFGLVKALDATKEAALTATGSLTGTPLYISPEGIKRPDDVDARSDLYAVGAVGYFLLTGTPVFDGQSVVEICMSHVGKLPETPSSRIGNPIDEDLTKVILNCLEKKPEDRPQTAVELLDSLAACEANGEWTRHEAQNWWDTHLEQIGQSHSVKTDTTVESNMAEATMIVKPTNLTG